MGTPEASASEFGFGLSGTVGTPDANELVRGFGLSGTVGTPDATECVPGFGLSGTVGTPDVSECVAGFGLSGTVGTPLANDIAKLVAATASTVIPIARKRFAVRDIVEILRRFVSRRRCRRASTTFADFSGPLFDRR